MTGRSIYFTEEEIKALTDTSTEWCGMMGDADDTTPVKERLDNGLGSALKKLYKGKNGERVYSKY
jgi:hypothetical protein